MTNWGEKKTGIQSSRGIAWKSRGPQAYFTGGEKANWGHREEHPKKNVMDTGGSLESGRWDEAEKPQKPQVWVEAELD